VRPRYSETYTFSTRSDGGVRLWVDGLSLVDTWAAQSPPREGSGRISLTAGQWYSIQLEYRHKHVPGSDDAVIQLFWSSRSQQWEIVPRSRLYSIRDEGARLGRASPGSATDAIAVGQTVLGQSGPLGSSEFGTPLFSETAHVFTVMVPAAQVPDPRQRAALQRVVEAEKPAHTNFHLCFVEARMRVGFQARLGIDSIVAGPPQPMDLTGTVLELDSYLGAGDCDGRAGRVGQRARIGRDAVIG
jgi:hypothetical protein